MQKLLLPVSLLLVALYGCQPDTPAQPPQQPATAIAPVAATSAPAAAAPTATASVGMDDAAMRALAQKDTCFTCHTLDNKLVGPAWRMVAVKYRGQKDAEAKLMDKVAKGGSGVWGPVAMPPNAPRVSEEDIRTLVRYILALQ